MPFHIFSIILPLHKKIIYQLNGEGNGNHLSTLLQDMQYTCKNMNIQDADIMLIEKRLNTDESLMIYHLFYLKMDSRLGKTN